jgi:AraC family transcriptional regulator, transcriptional activator of pobA
MKRFNTIGEFLEFRQLPKPPHPLIGVFKVEPAERFNVEEPKSWTYDFYAIALKRVVNAQDAVLKYGLQKYDYDSGIMSFVAPGQVLSLSLEDHVKAIQQSGWMMLIHPDFLWNTPLAQTIRQYDFWDYSVNEALFLSEKEEETLIHILQTIQQEGQQNIDKFTKNIIISHIETLLNYADRFYHRQFITREKANHQVLEKLERLLNEYFNHEKGLPTVADIAQGLNLSPKYLSSLLKVLTGQNTQQHIHEKLIEKAKEKLSTTNLSISEIAYELGFEHIQSFSKLFKSKTNLSPVEFRQSFN